MSSIFYLRSSLERTNTCVTGNIRQIAVPAVFLRTHNKPPKEKANKGPKVARAAKVGDHDDIINRVAEAPAAVFLHVTVVVRPGAEAQHASTAHEAGANNAVHTMKLTNRHSYGGGGSRSRQRRGTTRGVQH